MPFLREIEALDTCICAYALTYWLQPQPENLPSIVERNFQTLLNCVPGVKLIIHPPRACLAVSVQTGGHLQHTSAWWKIDLPCQHQDPVADRANRFVALA